MMALRTARATQEYEMAFWRSPAEAEAGAVDVEADLPAALAQLPVGRSGDARSPCTCGHSSPNADSA